MTLIKSISGIRGTIGGGVGVGLNPLDIRRLLEGKQVQTLHHKGGKIEWRTIKQFSAPQRRVLPWLRISR